MPLAPRSLLPALLLLCVACGDDQADATTDLGADLGADQGADMAPDVADVCAGVDCGPGGACRPLGPVHVCDCAQGFVPDDLRCVPAPGPVAPVIANLPATERGAVGQPDSFIVMASDLNQDALTFSVDAAACAFPVAVDAAGRVSWTCPATTAACDVTVTAADRRGLLDADTLTITCVNGLPAFSSTAPTAATEGVVLRYDIACADPEGQPVTLRVAPDDTCGGALEGSAYVWTPDESQGGSSCLLRVLCSDGEVEEAQAGMVQVAEANAAPAVADVAVERARRTLSCRYTFSDADGDPDASTIEWLVGGAAVGSGATFTAFASGDVVACRVTPRDGVTAGLPVTSPAITIVNDYAVSAGGGATCAIEGGGLYCWGDNTFGQLGDGFMPPAVTMRAAPARVVGMDAGVSAVSMGSKHACAIKASALYCWGDNTHGKLGDGSTTSARAPVQVVGMTSDVTAVSAGEDHTCAIQAGALHCWGRNSAGQLGDGTTTSASLPAPVAGLSSSVTAVAAGGSHTCAAQSGALFCWGADSQGQLGDGAPSASPALTPAQVNGLTSGVSAVAASGAHTCAVQSGALTCWGSNSVGQLGDDTTMSRAAPAQVVGMTSGVSAVAVSLSHTCAVQSGALKCWGSNGSGRLGDGTTTPVLDAPAQVVGLTSGVTAVATTLTHTCAVHADNFTCWGNNTFASIGAPGLAQQAPLPINGLLTADAIVAAVDHTCALQSGAATCWGDNQLGQLGDGATTNRAAPGAVTGLSQGVSVLVGGSGHTCALQGGAVKCWGDNRFGQLGDGTTTSSATPVQVVGLTSGVTALTAGDRHTCAVQSGAVKCWGTNGSNQLGDGTTTQRSAPVQVVGLTSGVTAIDSSNSHTCAIQSGALYCWGLNQRGQLGDDTALTAGSPVPVVGMTSGVTAVEAGHSHTCALRGGAVSCWGDNTFGILGDGTTTQRRTPAPVVGLTSGVTALSAGNGHTCAIQSGALYCWGANIRGQLGDGTNLIRSAPAQVVGLTSGVTAVSAGNVHTCAIQAGAPLCWGNNASSQLSYPLFYAAPRGVMIP